jgi:hypothetical protein
MSQVLFFSFRGERIRFHDQVFPPSPPLKGEQAVFQARLFPLLFFHLLILKPIPRSQSLTSALKPLCAKTFLNLYLTNNKDDFSKAQYIQRFA